MPSTGAGYSLHPASPPMGTQGQAGGVANGQGVGPVRATGGVIYWTPVVNVPYANTMGQVNLGWPPSQDVGGKDLPFNDVSTLRYFFNLGVEYFGISASMQKQHQQQLSCTTSPPAPLSQLPQGGPPGSSNLISPYPDPNSCMVAPPPAFQASGSFCNAVNSTSKPPVSPHPTKLTHNAITTSTNSTSSCPGPERKESMEMSSDVSDSGFTSSGEGEQGVEDDLDDQVDQLSKPSDDDTHSWEMKSAKGKGKRKYYMYGNHKLIKPIKDIPPRFQQLLTEAMAARARCEGQPIYMQEPSAEMISVNQESCNGLNADAQVFYPGQQYPVEGSTYSSFANTTVVSASRPPPIMVPHPSFLPNAVAAQNPGLVVACSVSSSLPPAPSAYGHGPNAGGVAPTEGTLVAKANEEGSMRSTASSGPSSRSAEGSLTPSSNTGEASCTTRVPGTLMVSSSSQPLTATSANLSPYFPPPATHPTSGAKPTCSMGVEKPAYYLYQSQSPSFSTMPPQGAGHTPNLSQGQLVYVLNPQSYGAPPSCVSYPPPMIGPSGHTAGLPCPPLAVQ